MRIGLLTACLLGWLIAGAQTPDIAQIEKDLAVFKTPMALELKKRVKKKDIEKISDPQLKAVALSMADKKYQTDYRVADYRAWLKPTTLGRQLMIGDGYSKYEGITGIYLPVGRQTVLVEGIGAGKEVRLLVPNWNRRAPEGIEPTKDPAGWGIKRQEFLLKNGVNIIELQKYDGLAYIDYYSDEPEKEQPIRVHFVNGKVNGYFDITRNNDADWNRLIDHAVYPIIDARGRHIQIAYPAEDCKKYAYGRGVELISNYDSLVYRQHRILGLIKYNKVPKNHILARVNYNYYMFRDGDGVAYMGTKPGNAMPLVIDPARVIKGDPCWGFSHEVGHVHQLRPYLNWGGLGEVSNNIFSLYGTTSFGNKSRISEQKNYQKARDSIIARNICYLQDKDVFNRLIPFWQLQLYFTGPGGYADFYPDLFEAFRLQGAEENNKEHRSGGWGNRGRNPAVYQLNFVKTVCQVGKTDLTDFFEKYGFFHVGKFEFGDYGSYNYEMTQEMANACKREIAALNLPKPKVDPATLED
ncbi:M60 family metallopeptidase [Niabella sp. CC-SYL272]|uniref:M60 family metallopeptidase n=1 Tax=Niabella agricola TaxID=2891571 RepID=UPI001F46EE53|nr:M60 family metallopeptidase [Niabella agricola]MCF3112209.1 M60 family metallopeptidase [Niabella agricola]